MPNPTDSVKASMVKGEVLSRDFAENFLVRMGYAPDGEIRNDAQYVDSVTNLQKKSGLPETGVIDIKTSNEIVRPRCGVSENKLVLGDSQIWRWNNPVNGVHEVLYYIHPSVPELLKIRTSEFDELCREVFEHRWCQHGMINRRRTNSPAPQFCVNVYARELDGPSSILAECELPVDGRRSCTMNIDVTEVWLTQIRQNAKGILIGNVLAHELGHGDGLTHSRIPSALMAAVYAVEVAHPVANDDVPRYEFRYGKRVAPIDPPPVIPAPIPGVPTVPTIPTKPGVIEKIVITIDGVDQVFRTKLS